MVILLLKLREVIIVLFENCEKLVFIFGGKMQLFSTWRYKNAYLPRQSINWEASPCLLAIPAFDRIARRSNRHLNSITGEYIYACANDFEGRLRALTDCAKD